MDNTPSGSAEFFISYSASFNNNAKCIIIIILYGKGFTKQCCLALPKYFRNTHLSSSFREGALTDNLSDHKTISWKVKLTCNIDSGSCLGQHQGNTFTNTPRCSCHNAHFSRQWREFWRHGATWWSIAWQWKIITCITKHSKAVYPECHRI